MKGPEHDQLLSKASLRTANLRQSSRIDLIGWNMRPKLTGPNPDCSRTWRLVSIVESDLG